MADHSVTVYDVLLMCAVTNSWSRPMHLSAGGPTPRAAHAMCSFGHHLVIFGGRDTESRTNDLHIYDTGMQPDSSASSFKSVFDTFRFICLTLADWKRRQVYQSPQ